MYCDFQDPLADYKLYTEVDDLDELASTVDEYLAEYNSMTNKPMNLVLFRYNFSACNYAI